MQKNFRSLLFGGMLPSTTLGTAVPSLVPWPNDSSELPLGESALRFSVTFAQSRDGAGSSTLRFASVSISKLLPARLTSGWLANAACTPISSTVAAAIAPNTARTAHALGVRRPIVALSHPISPPKGGTSTLHYGSPFTYREISVWRIRVVE